MKHLPRPQWTLIPAVALVTVIALAQRPQAPETRRDAVVETLHGVDLGDPYRWLEDQRSSETRAWIDAQNKYTESVIGPLPGKETIHHRLTELMKVDTISTPFIRGGRYFFTKRGANQDLSILYMRRSSDAPDEVLVDPHGMSADHTVSVGFQDVSFDGRVMLYGVRSGGEDEISVRMMEIDTRKELADRLPKARYSGLSLTPDKTRIYYARQTKEGPRVFVHAVGSDPSTDREIFGKGYGPEKIIPARLSDDGRYLIISVLHGSAARKVEVYVQDLRKSSPIQPIVNDIDANFNPEVAGDHMFLRTNWKAPNFRILDVDLQNPARDRWREVIPQGRSVINGLSPAGGKIVVNFLENVQSRIRVYEPTGKEVRVIKFPTLGSVGGISGDWERDEAFFTFSSFAQPTTIYRYEVSTGKRDIWARLNVPVNSENIELKQVWYSSKDGTKIPMFIAHRKGITLDGSNPTLLTGYGGFNLSMTPGFSQRAVFWIENGGVYALPNLRGGGEFGEAWHQAGMLEKKQNVFDDFIAAAEWLIRNRYTKPSKLAISGGSNGGLLVGAAMTQRPDLFQAVVCSYPLLDMVRYHRFLVAGYWVPEYGSADDPKLFKYIHAYSPYHHVKKDVKYPAVLFITGDGDTRVDPLHARKMTALLQAATGSDKPVLLRYDTKAGHSGGLPLSKIIRDLTDEMRFLFGQVGMSPPSGPSSTSAVNNDAIAARARKLHFSSFIIDTHIDTTPKLQQPDWKFTEEHSEGHVDLPRMKKGGLNALFFSIFMPGTVTGPKAVQDSLERIAAVHKLAEGQPEGIALCLTAEQARRAHQQGKVAAFMGMEGGHMIHNSLPILRMYARLGVRYLTLTHGVNTDWADSSGDQPKHNGLTDFGKAVVRELNRLGVIVDISHVADKTFWNALDVSRAPMIASHSSCRALSGHPRNMTDEMIKALAAKGGVIQINYLDQFIDQGLYEYSKKAQPLLAELRNKYPGRDRESTAKRREEIAKQFGPVPRVSWEKIIEHIDHAVKLAGADHVGLGSDFDGATMPEGMEDVTQLPKITEALLRKGYSESDIRKILGGNTLRLLAEVEQISLRMKSQKSLAE